MKLSMYKATIVAVLSISCISILSMSALPAFAFFDRILNQVDEVNDSVDRFDRTMQRSQTSVERVSEYLGIDLDESEYDEQDPVGTAIAFYQEWYSQLNDQEQETVSFLVLENAQGNFTDFRELVSSEWFLSQDRQEQAQISQNYMKLTQILELAQPNPSRFYASAFCIHGGRSDCQ